MPYITYYSEHIIKNVQQCKALPFSSSGSGFCVYKAYLHDFKHMQTIRLADVFRLFYSKYIQNKSNHILQYAPIFESSNNLGIS